MNYTARKLGRVVLRKSVSAEALSTFCKWEWKRMGVSNTFDSPLTQEIAKIVDVVPGREDGIMCFSNVPEHDDGWPDVSVNGVRCSSGFLHVVLAGKFVLHIGRQSMPLKRGDVFVMNPNKQHRVTTKNKMCSTAAYTVPIKHWWSLPEDHFVVTSKRSKQ